MAPTPVSRTITLADVARYAQVSTAVVSYVINDGPRPVAPATAERVRAAIVTLGYRPNSHARALMTGTTGILGLVIPATSNPFFGEFYDAIGKAAAEAGLALLSAGSAGSADAEVHLIDALARRDVDGIIVVTSMIKSDLNKLRDPRIPMLLVNCPFPIPGYRTLGPNGYEGARRAVDHLISTHRHRKVAMIIGDTGSPEPDGRELGWREAHRAHRLHPGPSIHAPFTLDGGYVATSTLLRQNRPPRALFASSDLQAIGALHAIHEHHLAVPDDIAVATFDATSQSAHTWPPLTAAHQPIAAMAHAAVTGLVADAPREHTLFDMSLELRESCGCQPIRVDNP